MSRLKKTDLQKKKEQQERMLRNANQLMVMLEWLEEEKKKTKLWLCNIESLKEQCKRYLQDPEHLKKSDSEYEWIQYDPKLNK